MRLTIIGCSGSYPGPQSPASCYLVQTEHEGRTWSILLDLGNGALGTLHRHLAADQLDAVVLSHLHPDHCADLTGLYVVRHYDPQSGDRVRLPVYGPAGTDDRIARMYGVEGPQPVDDVFDFRVIRDREPLEVGPFRVVPMLVNHPVEAYGLRVEADGAVLSYTGDTDACPALTELHRDATLVLSDSAFVDGRDTASGVHLSGGRAAQAAVDAGGVQRLMLTHIPAWNDPEVCRAQAAAVWPGEVELARPEATYEL